ncbi:ATP-binding cassette domain-containing protein [Legionella sp. km772]|uniref:ATP-binding cassette domain-containing protein n=1 Tax=Legionella sp. km772 TaxID=2498111 RepID=UPI000F8E09E4|nr:ATP-binding cassette domain-containing protein [Legionella sp. km772]RUR04664.1 ABC-F family ATP-binding cassette domain-containing protein [Legionella sp. km772]
MNCLIQLIDLSLYFSNQIYFESFNTKIFFGERIALIGDNGCGKSSLLKIISRAINPSEGIVRYQEGLHLAYVPQIRETTQLSGAELFNQALTEALAQHPDILILDEPTNHLDKDNRRSLFRLLEQFHGTLIIATHDVALLKQSEYIFWHIKQRKISSFYGYFENLQRQNIIQQQVLQQELEQLNKQKKQAHDDLMQEQKRAKNSRLKGEKSLKSAKWPTIVSQTKALRAQETSGKKKKALLEHKEELLERIIELGFEEEINPQFALASGNTTTKSLVTIQNGSLFYGRTLIVDNINLNISSLSRLALCGKNGSGKSTLLKAIKNDSKIDKQGLWITPPSSEIGYLDQHYHDLTPGNSVLDCIQEVQPSWNHQQIRRHLNDFLFRKNEQVYALVDVLSGGEKTRLSLAKIAAKPPKLLILLMLRTVNFKLPYF